MTNDTISEAAQRIVLDAQEIQHISFSDAVLVAQAVLDAQGREARLRAALLGLSGGGSAPCWCARLPHTETCLAARAALETS